MFTGIIQALGKIASMTPAGGDLRLGVSLGALASEPIALGDSVAVNGVCLTAVELQGDVMTADVSNETLTLTSLGQLGVGDAVNLELALTPTSRLGGHIVSGHVDGLGSVARRYPDARSERFHFNAPRGLMPYIAPKGSITIDGTSLTVNGVSGDSFDVNIVPHTLAHTVMGGYKVGTQVNLEVDVVARYVERLLTTG
ncbi:MAG: riboflavin synthase, partial [Pseudomonadota bacterium]